MLFLRHIKEGKLREKIHVPVKLLYLEHEHMGVFYKSPMTLMVGLTTYQTHDHTDYAFVLLLNK